MIESVRKKLKVEPEKVPYSLYNFGNTSSATVPLTMLVKLREQLVSQKLNLLLSGFGVGLSWGSCYLETEKLFVLNSSKFEMNFTPDYSIVVPVYNSENTLEELCLRVEETFNKMNSTFEIILVNDMSSDGSWWKIKLLKEKYGECLLGINLRKISGNTKLCFVAFSLQRANTL